MSAERVTNKVRAERLKAEKARSQAAENIRSAVLEAYRTINPEPSIWVTDYPDLSSFKKEREKGIIVNNGVYEDTYVEDQPGILIDSSGIYTFPGGRGFGSVKGLGSYTSREFYYQREPITPEQCLKYAEMIASAVDRRLNPQVPATAH